MSLGMGGTTSTGRWPTGPAGGLPLGGGKICRQASLLQVLIDQLREARASVRRNQSVRTRFLRNVDDNWSLSQRVRAGSLQACADFVIFSKACDPILLCLA